jgi:dTDP-4-dehydrorhamnose reductase
VTEQVGTGPRVLVLGAGGMAGHTVSTYLREAGYDVVASSHRPVATGSTTLLDVTDRSALESFLDNGGFDVVVNCVGMLVAASEEQKDRAVYVNAYFPHQLERYYAGTATRVIHLSTDCVFSGEDAPYSETSSYDGELFYDRSKALGEVRNDKDLTLRMSIIGPDRQESGVGLFNWFYAQTGVVTGYTGAIWSGITTIELARGIDAGIRQGLTGLYHLVPAGNISKYDLLRLLASTFDRSDITVQPVTGVVRDMTLVNTRTDFDFEVADYPTMLQEMRAWVLGHRALYPHYRL